MGRYRLLGRAAERRLVAVLALSWERHGRTAGVESSRPARGGPGHGGTGLDRLQRPYERGPLPCRVRPRQRRALRRAGVRAGPLQRAHGRDPDGAGGAHPLPRRGDRRGRVPGARPGARALHPEAPYRFYMENLSRQGLAATHEEIALHVELARRRSSPLPPQGLARIEALEAAQAALPRPTDLGRVISL